MLDIDQRLELIGRLDIREGVLQLALPLAVGAEGVPLAELALRVEAEQVAGQLLDGGARAALGALPVLRPQARELRHGVARADVARDAVELVDRHVQPVAVGVAQVEVLALGLADGAADQALVDRDAVLDVHHVVAVLQAAQERRTLLGAAIALALALGHRPALPPAEDLGVRVERQVQVGRAPAFVERSMYKQGSGVGGRGSGIRCPRRPWPLIPGP